MKTQLPASLSGTITAFKGNGRKLGYPTANIDIPTDLSDGIYFGFASLSSYTRQPALIFIGTPTTVGDTTRRVEAHLLDIPDVDYYHQELILDVRYFHRANETFTTIDDLIAVIQADEKTARAWFKSQE
ncbi:MAG TPA: riboflavin kinase [Patescibacteria group bacterium]|nr:riboflavin kinase [Patescibacteria group bacterium]